MLIDWCRRCYRDNNKEDLSNWDVFTEHANSKSGQGIVVCKRCREDLQKARTALRPEVTENAD